MNPNQIQLVMVDPYHLIAEVLPDLDGAIIDGGANVGQATRALRKCFPHHPIHAFEPVAEAYRELESCAVRCDAHAHRLALGDTDHETEIRINKNLWTCSLLDASERGHQFHDDWCETVRTERVRVVRLDSWARSQGVERIGLLKLDLQGFELAALRGAGDLLSRTQVVYSEAQIVPEYEGAATFARLDTFLNERGFGLYQMIDLCLKGPHAEPSCCDGLWIRQDLLAGIRERGTPEAITRAQDRRSMLMSRALIACRDAGLQRVAIYGAGAHTAACGPALATPPVEVEAIIDDARSGASMWRIPIVTRAQAIEMRPDAIILSSDRAERDMLFKSDEFLDAGIAVVSLYEGGRVTVRTPRNADAITG